MLQIGRYALWAWRYTWKRYPALIAGAATLSFSRSLMPAAQALASRELINALIAVAGAGGQGDISLSVFWVAILLASTLFGQFTGIAQNEVMQRLVTRLQRQLTIDLLTHASRLPVATFEDTAAQDTMERARQNMAQRMGEFLRNLVDLGGRLVQIGSLALLVLAIEPLSLLLTIPTVLPFFLIDLRIAKAQYQLHFAQAEMRRWTNYFVNVLTSRMLIGEVRIWNLAPLLLQRCDEIFAKFIRADLRFARLRTIGDVISNTLFAGVFFMVLLSILQKLAVSVVTVGDMAIYARAVPQLGALLNDLRQSLALMLEQSLYVGNFLEFLALEPDSDPHADVDVEVKQGNIQIRDLSFTYSGTDKPALQGITLDIPAGALVAIVGQNGAGKSTLAKVLTRQFDPPPGTVLVDGQDITLLPRAKYQAQIGFIQQSFARFEATVGENIAYGNWQQLLGHPEKVQALLQRLGLTKLIESLPDGMDTMLGRMFGKVELSGGQWQQLALARVFARDTWLYIFDEPTSAIDPLMEKQLVQQLAQWVKGRTAILISHRFTSVEVADFIVVLHGGRLAESGTHEDLLHLNGEYARLYSAAKTKLNTMTQPEAVQ